MIARTPETPQAVAPVLAPGTPAPDTTTPVRTDFGVAIEAVVEPHDGVETAEARYEGAGGLAVDAKTPPWAMPPPVIGRGTIAGNLAANLAENQRAAQSPAGGDAG